MGSRRVLRAAFLCASVLLAGNVAVTAAIGVAGVHGVVRDTLGGAVGDVEILFLDAEVSAAPAVRVLSDADGRFSVASLVPGLYRVAAVKRGYRVYLGEVDTVLRSTLDVVMHPLPRPGEPGSEWVPPSAAWALRVPRRGLLQDVEAESLLAARFASAEHAPDASLLGDSLQGQVEQSFAIAAAKPGDWSGGVQGTETRMRLDGLVGERARLSLGGHRTRLDDGVTAAPARRDSSGVRLGLHYQTSLDTDLSVNAFYGRRDFDLAPSSDAGGSLATAERSWGYDAAWSKQLSSLSRLELGVEYRDASVELPAVGSASAPGGPSAVTNRTVGATGSYVGIPGPGHEVKLAFRARYIDLPLATSRPATIESAAFPGDNAGFSVGLNAEDSWSVAAPWTLVYGMGYRHVLADRDLAVLVPEVGGVYAAGPLAMRVVVSYHASSSWDRPAVQTLDVRDPVHENAFGYEAGIEAAFPAAVRVRGDVAYTPLVGDPFGQTTDATGTLRPMFLSDGTASLHQISGTLTRDAASCSLSLQVRRGSVDGLVAGILPYDAPYQFLTPSHLRFRTTRLGVRVPASGTDVTLEYRRIVDRPDDGDPLAATRPGTQVQGEVRLLQDLARLDTGATWRFLLVVQVAALDGAERDSDAPTAPPWYAYVPRSHGQINAGVSVAF